NATADIDISPSAPTTTVICSHQSSTGPTLSPCSSRATGSAIAPPGIDVSASLVYTNNTNAGTAHASASYAGDANHSASNGAADSSDERRGGTTSGRRREQAHTDAGLSPCSVISAGAVLAPTRTEL